MPLRRPWPELAKEALLPLYPWRALTHLLEYLLKWCVHRGDDLDRSIRVYSDRQGPSILLPSGLGATVLTMKIVQHNPTSCVQRIMSCGDFTDNSKDNDHWVNIDSAEECCAQ
jgi:hypothetical protein